MMIGPQLHVGSLFLLVRTTNLANIQLDALYHFDLQLESERNFLNVQSKMHITSYPIISRLVLNSRSCDDPCCHTKSREKRIFTPKTG